MKHLLAVLLLVVPVAAQAPVRLRIVAGNLTSGNKSSYDLGHGVRILKALKPDVALIQETNYRTNSQADLDAFVNDAFGTGYTMFREPNRPKPNAIVSRYPIVSSGVWEDTAAPDREFVFARIDIPGPVDLWAVSVHLLTNDGRRGPEASQLANFVRTKVPAGDYLVVGGDLNTDTMRDRAFNALTSVIRIPDTLPADQRGRTGTNANRKKPYDHVLPNAALHAKSTPVKIGASTFANGLVVDTRVYTPLSELAPALRGDSGASQMQHMAVVRDFALTQ